MLPGIKTLPKKKLMAQVSLLISSLELHPEKWKALAFKHIASYPRTEWYTSTNAVLNAKMFFASHAERTMIVTNHA